MKYLIILFALSMTACGFEVVDTGHRGLYVNFGKVTGEPLVEGLYFYNPFTTSIKELDVREQKMQGKTTAFTKDTQSATIEFTITYYPKKEAIGELYSNFGWEWDKTIVPQVVLGVLKNEVGQIIADDLVGKRQAITAEAEKQIRDALLLRNVIVTRLDLTNLDYDDAYERAVEKKVVAIQEAIEAKNTTVKIQEQAKQTIETAKAAAESMRIKTEALSKNKGLVDYEIAQRWDGKLPEIMMGGATPMIDFSKLRARNE